jgi:hypothetical protein
MADDPTLKPPAEPKLFKGYNHLKYCLSFIVPNQMARAHYIRTHSALKPRGRKG